MNTIGRIPVVSTSLRVISLAPQTSGCTWRGRRTRDAFLTIVGSLLLAAVSHAATLLGPVLPTALPQTQDAVTVAGNYGRPGGKTWTYGNRQLRNSTSVWHTDFPGAVKLSFINDTFSGAGEVMTFDAAGSNLAGGVLLFKGQTLLPGNPTPVFTTATLTYTSLSAVAIGLATPASVGAPASVGGLALVPFAGFKLNYLFRRLRDT